MKDYISRTFDVAVYKSRNMRCTWFKQYFSPISLLIIGVFLTSTCFASSKETKLYIKQIKQRASLDASQWQSWKNSIADLNIERPNSSDYRDEDKTEWYDNVGLPFKGVALVVHDLQYRPSKMQDLVTFMQLEGYKVLRLSLFGHRGEERDLVLSNSKLWRNEFLIAYKEARKIADELGVPLVFAGFSLGALIALEQECASYDVPVTFNRQILLAPPIEFKNSVNFLINFITTQYPYYTEIKTPSPFAYATSETTPVASVIAIKNFRDSLKRLDFNRASIPTLVLINQFDEIIDAQKLVEFVDLRDSLKETWNIEYVSTLNSELPRSSNHLIADSKSVGRIEWERMKKMMHAHLSSNF